MKTSKQRPEITVSVAMEILRTENQLARRSTLTVYAEAFVEYAHASAAIARQGTVVANPKTGIPIPNPYIKVRAAALATMNGRPLKTDALWELVS